MNRAAPKARSPSEFSRRVGTWITCITAGLLLGLLLLQDHGVELAGAFLQLAFEDRHLLRRGQGAAGPGAARLTRCAAAGGIATRVAAALGASPSGAATGVSATAFTHGAAFAGTPGLLALSAFTALAHGLFHGTHGLVEGGFVVAHIRQGVTVAGGALSEPGVARRGVARRGIACRRIACRTAFATGTGGVLHARFAAFTAFARKFSLGEVAQVAVAAALAA